MSELNKCGLKLSDIPKHMGSNKLFGAGMASHYNQIWALFDDQKLAQRWTQIHDLWIDTQSGPFRRGILITKDVKALRDIKPTGVKGMLACWLRLLENWALAHTKAHPSDPHKRLGKADGMPLKTRNELFSLAQAKAKFANVFHKIGSSTNDDERRKVCSNLINEVRKTRKWDHVSTTSSFFKNAVHDFKNKGITPTPPPLPEAAGAGKSDGDESGTADEEAFTEKPPGVKDNAVSAALRAFAYDERYDVTSNTLLATGAYFRVEHGDAIDRTGHGFSDRFLKWADTKQTGLKAHLCLTDPPWGTQQSQHDSAWSSAEWVQWGSHISKCMRDDGYIFVFIPHTKFQAVNESLASYGWEPFKYPLIWYKTGAKQWQFRIEPHSKTELIFGFSKKQTRSTPQVSEEMEKKFLVQKDEIFSNILRCKAPTASEIQFEDQRWKGARAVAGEDEAEASSDIVTKNLKNKKAKGKARFREEQKPLHLLETLVRRYASMDNAIVIDPTCGTGSTGVAAVLQGTASTFLGTKLVRRSFFGMDFDKQGEKVADEFYRERLKKLRKEVPRKVKLELLQQSATISAAGDDEKESAGEKEEDAGDEEEEAGDEEEEAGDEEEEAGDDDDGPGDGEEEDEDEMDEAMNAAFDAALEGIPLPGAPPPVE